MTKLEQIQQYRKIVANLYDESNKFDVEIMRRINFWDSKIQKLRAEIIDEKRFIEGILRLCRTGK